MEDENIEDTSSHPFFVRAEFPFAFIPTTSTTGFSFANNHTHVIDDDDQTTTEFLNENETIEETIDDEVDHNEENDDDDIELKTEVRISQPKYSQLLKDLDFSHTRMVDVTNLLSDEAGSYLTPDENENQKKHSSDERYQSLSSARSSISSDEPIIHQFSSNIKKDDKNLTNAANDILNDLNHLADIIHQASQIQIEEYDNENLTNDPNDIQNDLNSLATIIQEASQTPTEEYDNENLTDAPNDKQNNLATIIQEASQTPTEKYDNENLTNDPNDLNYLATIIQEASQIPTEDTQKKSYFEEDDDTSKQATQNYDLNDNEQEDIGTSLKSNKNLRFTTQNSNTVQDDNLSSIPRLNTSTNNRTENANQSEEYPITWENLLNRTDAFIQSPTVLISSEPINDIHTTSIKEESLSSPKEKAKQRIDSSSKQNVHHRLRHLSTSSSTDSVDEHTLNRSKQKQHSTSQPQLSIDEDLNDLNTHLKQVLIEQDRPYTTASDILIRRLSNQQIDRTSPNKKKSHHHHHRSSTDTWLSMLEKLEHEHKERLEKQQKQYEDYMRDLEEKMKQRFDKYFSTTNSLQESKSQTFDESTHLRHTQNSAPIDSNAGRYRTYSNTYPYRPLSRDHYPTNSTTHIAISDKQQTIGTSLSRSHSREDISNLRTELSTKHAKHVSDLKLYYEHEVDELKNQLNRSTMGPTSSSTRQSIETIERINNENIRLYDEMKDLRHSLKITEEENHSLKRQLEELRDQLNNKDLELKNFHRTNLDLEQQLNEAHNIKERQDEKFRHVDRQALIYREENEKITSELNLTRERLLRLEERYRELENENKTFRQPGFTSENNKQRMVDDLKLNSTMFLNMPTSREYGRFTLSTSKYSSSSVNTSRDANLDSGRYTTTVIGSDDLFRHDNFTRPLTRLTDYINEKPTFPQAYVPPSRPLYSPRKTSPNHHSIDPLPVKDLIDNQIRQSEQLEEKFDELLKKKRDLESRINRIPTRGLTNTDRQLLDVLEREIERVEQQISSVKLELRKMNILRTH